MDMTEFERTTDSRTAANFSGDNTDIIVGHYGFENSKPDKPLITSKDYPTFRLHFIIGGSLTLYVEGKPHPLKRDHCFVLRPDADTAYRTDIKDPASFYWVSVSGQKCKAYFAQMGLCDGNYSIAVPKELSRNLRKTFFANFHVDEALKEITDSVFTANFLKIYQLLYLAAHKDRTAGQMLGTRQKSYIEQTLEYVNLHYSDPGLTIREIAGVLYLHENYLSHIFREAMGLPFREYLTQKRISMSYTLMESGMTSVSEIAYAVGFSDALYFSKVFKHFNGISPKEHLNRMRKSTPPRLNY